jgi:hypothetical protein
MAVLFLVFSPESASFVQMMSILAFAPGLDLKASSPVV